jgi:hypothetical protein
MLFKQWIIPIISKDFILHGFSKTYYIKQNALSNLNFISIVILKIFNMDDKPYED